MESIHWIDLGDFYRPIEVIIIGKDALEHKAKELGVYDDGEIVEGLWVSNDHSIYVSSEPVHNTAEFVLLHELTHAFDDLCESHTEEENQVDCKAALLAGFLTHNPKLIDAIRNKELV